MLHSLPCLHILSKLSMRHASVTPPRVTPPMHLPPSSFPSPVIADLYCASFWLLSSSSSWSRHTYTSNHRGPPSHDSPKFLSLVPFLLLFFYCSLLMSSSSYSLTYLLTYSAAENSRAGAISSITTSCSSTSAGAISSICGAATATSNTGSGTIIGSPAFSSDS